VQLVDVDPLGLQPAQAVFHIQPHVGQDLRVVAVYDLVGLVEDVPELGGNDRPVAPSLERLPQNPLAVPDAVVGGRVELRDAGIQRSLDCPDGFPVVGLAPTGRVGLFPGLGPGPRPADGPAAHAQGADVDTALAQSARLRRSHLIEGIRLYLRNVNSEAIFSNSPRWTSNWESREEKSR